MTLNKEECNHDFQPLSPNDPLRSECAKCGRAWETNSYTGEKTEMKSKESIEHYRHFFDKSCDESSSEFSKKETIILLSSFLIVVVAQVVLIIKYL